jgi:hypothetical protein
MQIIQAGPSRQTLRQAALNDSMNQIMGGLQQMDHQAQTKRQEALQIQSMTNDLRKQGYEVNQDQVAAHLAPEPSGFAKLFGAKAPEKTDLYGKRTQEYMDTQRQAQSDRSLERQYKQAQINNLNKGTDPNGYKAKKEELELKKLNNELAQTPQQKAQNELAQTQQQDLGKKSANLYSVKVAMDKAHQQLTDPNLSEEEKIKAGQGLLKLLNSAEGADAVGAEEAKRIGSFLENKMFNFFEPGSMFGRDLDLFSDQVKNNSALLAERIKGNQHAIDSLGSGRKLSDLVGEEQAVADGGLKPMNFRGSNPGVQYNPTRSPDMIGSVHAGNVVPATEHPHASAALEWARKNPSNPKAKDIILRLGGGK